MTIPLKEYTVEHIHASITAFSLSVGTEHSTPSVVICGNAASLDTIKLQKKRTRFDLTISPFGARLDVSDEAVPSSVIKDVLLKFLRDADAIPERYRTTLIDTAKGALT